MRNKEVVSAIVGGTFFAVPYLGLSIALAPALAIGCVAFGASELVLSGIKGKETTPYLLDKVQKLTGGDSLESNIKLVLNNAALSCEIAKQLAC